MLGLFVCAFLYYIMERRCIRGFVIQQHEFLGYPRVAKMHGVTGRRNKHFRSLSWKLFSKQYQNGRSLCWSWQTKESQPYCTELFKYILIPLGYIRLSSTYTRGASTLNTLRTVCFPLSNDATSCATCSGSTQILVLIIVSGGREMSKFLLGVSYLIYIPENIAGSKVANHICQK